MQWGLVDRVFAPEELEQETIAYARLIAENSPLSVRASKFFLDQSARDHSARDPARIKAMTEACADSADFKEATSAFLQKRKAPIVQRPVTTAGIGPQSDSDLTGASPTGDRLGL